MQRTGHRCQNIQYKRETEKLKMLSSNVFNQGEDYKKRDQVVDQKKVKLDDCSNGIGENHKNNPASSITKTIPQISQMDFGSVSNTTINFN